MGHCGVDSSSTFVLLPVETMPNAVLETTSESSSEPKFVDSHSFLLPDHRGSLLECNSSRSSWGLFLLTLGFLSSVFLSLGRQAFVYSECFNLDRLVFLGFTFVGQPQLISMYRPLQSALFIFQSAGYPKFWRLFLFFFWDFRYWFSQKIFFSFVVSRKLVDSVGSWWLPTTLRLRSSQPVYVVCRKVTWFSLLLDCTPLILVALFLSWRRVRFLLLASRTFVDATPSTSVVECSDNRCGRSVNLLSTLCGPRHISFGNAAVSPSFLSNVDSSSEVIQHPTVSSGESFVADLFFDCEPQTVGTLSPSSCSLRISADHTSVVFNPFLAPTNHPLFGSIRVDPAPGESLSPGLVLSPAVFNSAQQCSWTAVMTDVAVECECSSVPERFLCLSSLRTSEQLEFSPSLSLVNSFGCLASSLLIFFFPFFFSKNKDGGTSFWCVPLLKKIIFIFQVH